MGANIFALSDTHFHHENTWKKFVVPDWKHRCGQLDCDYGRDACKFKHPEIPLRPFTSTEEMDEFMIDKWNSVVRPQDHVYHGGDVAINPKVLDRFMPRLNGHKRLILGNHDHWNWQKFYAAWFEKVFSSRILDGMLFTHIPIHPSGLGRFKVNIHGHVHSNTLPDQRYFNMCVEALDYTPIALEDIKQYMKPFL